MKALLAVAAMTLAGCTPEQVAWWADAPKEDRDVVVEHIIAEAADEFGVDAGLLTRIGRCESGLRPEAVNRTSGAAGLLQHLPSYWAGRAAAIGLDGASPFDPVANARVSAWMLATQGTAPWASSKGCWS